MRLAGMFKWLAREKHATGGSHDDVGGEVAELDRPDEPAAPSARAAAADPAVATAWPAMRLEVTDSLWGDGSTMPGGTDEVMRLALPFGLGAQTSMLLLGGGSGGAAMRLAGELGVWVQAYETDACLAAAGARRVQRSGVALAKRATVQTWDPAAPAFRKSFFNHAVLIESLSGPRPQSVLKSVAQSLKGGAQMALLETVATEPLDAADPAVRAWCRLERRALPRTGTGWISDPLVKAGWDLRTEEDMSIRQAKLAVAGWRHMVRELRLHRPPPRQAAVLVAEAELWLRRVQLLREGKIKLIRWHFMGRM